jgi:hypothetical protein
MLRATHTFVFIFPGAKVLPGNPGAFASPLGNGDAADILSEDSDWAYPALSARVGSVLLIAFVVFF